MNALRTAIIVCALLMATASIAAAQQAPDITGSWKAQGKMHHMEKGFLDGHGATYEILEQQGNLLRGRKTWEHGGETYQETFSGIVTPEGDIYFAEQMDGIMLGKMVDKKTLRLYYLESGPDGKAIVLDLVKE